MPEQPYYRVEVRSSAVKELRALPPGVRSRVYRAIDALRDDPRPSGAQKLKGGSDPLYRLRVGVYRVIFSVDDSLRLVVIARVRHRREAYG